MKYDIIVCGDSRSSAPVHGNPKTGERDHFSQFLQDQYGYKVLNLARGGMSNLGICFQMKEAISIGSRYVIYHKTWSSRVNLIVNSNFTIENGLKNFIYPFVVDESTYCEYVGHNKEFVTDQGIGTPDNQAGIFSTVWQELDKNTTVKISKDQLQAINGYLKHLFHEGLQDEVDLWMFQHWHQQILNAGMTPIELTTTNFAKPMFDFMYTGKAANDPYHTDTETQALMAQLINQIILGMVI
jgi:hypothetical protein